MPMPAVSQLASAFIVSKVPEPATACTWAATAASCTKPTTQKMKLAMKLVMVSSMAGAMVMNISKHERWPCSFLKMPEKRRPP